MRRYIVLDGLQRPPSTGSESEKLRIFYDVQEDRVEILAVVDKAAAAGWLEEEGRGTEEGGRR